MKAVAGLVLALALVVTVDAAPPAKPLPVAELDTWAGSQLHRKGAIDLGAALVHPMGENGWIRPGIFVAQNRGGIGIGVKPTKYLPIAVGINYLKDWRDGSVELGGYGAITAAF